MSNVSVSIIGYPTMPSASTTVQYSVNGGAYSASPTFPVIPYNGSFTLRIEAGTLPLTAAYCSGGGNPCTITLQGTSGAITATKTFTITPTNFNPQFQEQ